VQHQLHEKHLRIHLATERWIGISAERSS
jgi:hypothetical protein